MAELTVDAGTAGKTCPYCRFPLKGGSAAIACDSCGTVHHTECWDEGGGCSVFGCRKNTAAPAQPPPLPMEAQHPPQPVPQPTRVVQDPPAQAGPPGRGPNTRVLVLVGLATLLIGVSGTAAIIGWTGSSPSSPPAAQTGGTTPTTSTGASGPAGASGPGRKTGETVATRSSILGRSVLGQPIKAIEVGDPSAQRKILVVGCIHGNECAGMAVTTLLARSHVPAGVDLWVVPNLNPDGFLRNTRQNADGVDLNRNFPWHWQESARGSSEYSGPRALSEPESRIASKLILRVRPELTVWFHQRAAPGRPSLVDTSVGDVAVEERYARLVGFPAVRLAQYPGGVTNWQNATFPGTTAFVVELPFEATMTPAAAKRHADAVLAIAKG